MTIYIYNNYSNSEVTNHYLDIIRKGIEQSGKYKCEFISGYKNISHSSVILISNPLDLFRLYIKGYRYFLLWMQGITPEESYLRHKSRLRYKILSYIDKFALKKSMFTFLVSSEMKTFLERKYNIILKEYYIMPCYNDQLDLAALETPSKYTSNTFAYIGSLAVWQCFEQTLQLYKEVEKRYDDAKLSVYTKDSDMAKLLLEKYNIKNYEIDYVNPEEIKERLKKIKYGFVIREDISVNNVATPTKISNYMSAGVIPIITSSIKDFSKRVKGKSSICQLHTTSDSEHLLDYLEQDITKEAISNDYSEIFNSYYNDDYHIRRIGKLIRDRNFAII